MIMRRTLPQLLADGLIALGVVPRPAPLSVPVPETRKREAITSRVQSTAYEPDKEFEGLENASGKTFDLQADDYEIESASLYEVASDGRSYRVNRYYSRMELLEAIERADKGPRSILSPTKLREAKSPSLEQYAAQMLQHAVDLLREGMTLNQVRQQLRESFDDGSDYGGDSVSRFQDWTTGAYDSQSQYGSGVNVLGEYMPLMGGPWSKQLYLYQYLDMHRKAFEAFNHNPVAKQLINLTTYFTLGRGIDHTCTNVEVEEVVREFTDRTDFYARLEQMFTDCWWAGEMFIEWYDNEPERGLTDFRCIDPSTIWDIITDPEDIRKVYYAHQQYQTPAVQFVAPGDNRAVTKYIIRQIPSKDFYHVKLNVSEWEKRGRSDLFPVLGWVKRLKDLMNARVVKGILEAAFCWDITVQTGDADVSQMAIQLPDPFQPGSTFVHNSSLKLESKASTVSGSDAMPDINTLLNMISVGVGTPKEFIGEISRGARAGALVATEPGTKRYETRQQLIERTCHKIMDRVIQNAIDGGLLDPDEFLADARSVKRLATVNGDDLPDRDELVDDIEQAQAQADAHAKDIQQQSMQIAADSAKAAAQNPPNLVQPNRNGAQSASGANGKQPPNLVRVGARESGSSIVKTSKNEKPLNDEQKRRIKAIKKTGMYSRELIEFSFPAIAQEDRAQKLKDLALVEAMEWLPKSVTATMAAKELNISTYDFAENWATIVEEAKKGMSIAHVFGQDNKHTPFTTLAQDVQEENAAKQPMASETFSNVPVPPAVNGMKQVPNKPGAGNQPNSGDTKVNNKMAPQQPNPTARSHGYSKAANHPMTSEGAENLKRREADVQRAIYTTLLKEAIKPMLTTRTAMARYILEDPEAVQAFEAAVDETDTDKT